jgi:Fungal specific transcription factor domain
MLFRSSKAYIETLQDRAAELEGSRSSNPSLGLAEDAKYFPVPTAVQPGTRNPNKSGTRPPIQQSTSLDYQILNTDYTNASRIMLNTNSMIRDFGLNRTTPSSLPRSMVEEFGRHSVADRLGNMKSNLCEDENGQLHFFGYSSNLQIVSFLPTSPPLTDLQSPSQVTEFDVEKLADSKDTKDHLIELYFTYQHPALPMLDEDTFKQGYRAGTKSQYFSPFLLYSILLRSLRLSNKPGIHELGAVFLRRAKAELFSEMETPTISTIQALCLFGHYLGSIGNDRSCWLFPGMFVLSVVGILLKYVRHGLPTSFRPWTTSRLH